MEEKGVRSLLLRNFNQDPIENFFGAICSLGYRKNNPSTQGFSSSYKTLMLNNLTSSHSTGNNCEEDFSEGTLTSYRILFKSIKDYNDLENVYDEPRVYDRAIEPTIVNNSPEIYLKLQTQNYIAGFIVKKRNKILFKNCRICLDQICNNKVGQFHDLIIAGEYNNQPNLKYPNVTFCRLIQGITFYKDLTFSQLPLLCHKQNFKSYLISKIQEQYNLKIINCPIHINDFENKLLNFTIQLLTNHWCVEINRLLNGKKKLGTNTDHIKKQQLIDILNFQSLKIKILNYVIKF